MIKYVYNSNLQANNNNPRNKRNTFMPYEDEEEIVRTTKQDEKVINIR